ncbi:hypothetical protein N9L28_05865 [Luminiphilus sp.]|nr:hypothetical protein [Luminiphilus sp.]
MPRKDAKYDKEVKTTMPDLKTKEGRDLYRMRKETKDLARETRDRVLEKNRIRVAGEGKKGRAKADAAEKARGGKPALSAGAQRALIGGQKPKKKRNPPKDFHYEYK